MYGNLWSTLHRRSSLLLLIALLAALPAAAQETLELRLMVDRVDEHLQVTVRLIGADLGKNESAR